MASENYMRIEGSNFVTIKEYANLRNVTRQTVYRWINAKKTDVVTYRLLNRTLIKV